MFFFCHDNTLLPHLFHMDLYLPWWFFIYFDCARRNLDTSITQTSSPAWNYTTIYSLQTSHKVLRFSVGFLPPKVFFMVNLDVRSMIINRHRTQSVADAISNTHKFKMVNSREQGRVAFSKMRTLLEWDDLLIDLKLCVVNCYIFSIVLYDA